MPLRKVKVSGSSEISVKGSDASAMENLFGPLTVLLRLFGCKSTLLQKFREGNMKDVTYKNVLHFLYCVFLIAFLWFNFLLHTFKINSEIQKGMTVNLSTILFSSCILLTVSFHATTSLWTLSGEFHKTLKQLVEYERDFGMCFDATKLKRRLNFIYAVIYMCCFLLAISLPFILALRDEKSYFVRSFLSSDLFGPSQSTDTSPHLFPILSFCLFLTWGLAICYTNVYMLPCHVICKELNGFIKSFAQETKTQTTQVDIQRHRNKFERIERVLRQLNICIYHCPPIVVSTSLVASCLLLYGLVQGKMLVEDVIIACAFLLFVILLSALLIGFGILTNEKMHAPLEILYSLDLDKMSEKAGIQVSIFINRLSTRPLGISVYGFFVIEKSTILMMLGTVLTYFVVMIQMNPSNTAQCDLQSILELLNATKS